MCTEALLKPGEPVGKEPLQGYIQIPRKQILKNIISNNTTVLTHALSKQLPKSFRCSHPPSCLLLFRSGERCAGIHARACLLQLRAELFGAGAGAGMGPSQIDPALALEHHQEMRLWA